MKYVQYFIPMVVAFVVQLLSGKYPDHVKAWRTELLPLRDALNQLYPVEQHPASDVAPPMPMGLAIPSTPAADTAAQ